jgi:hypothetical protein
MKNRDRVHHPDHGYGTVDEEGEVRVHVQWDDGTKGGYEVKQLSTGEQAKARGSKLT